MDDIFGDPDIPDIYVDTVKIAAGVFGFVLEMGLQGVLDAPGSESPPIRRLVKVRMSPQHALVLARLLNKHVDHYQDQVGRIQLPPDVYESLGLDPE